LSWALQDKDGDVLERSEGEWVLECDDEEDEAEVRKWLGW
jgi:hypothetical protein